MTESSLRWLRVATLAVAAAILSSCAELRVGSFLERLQTDVDTQLAAKGFERTTSAMPDLLLHYHANTWQQLDASAVDLKRYGLCADCQPSLYAAGTLLLDFVDARTNKLVWRGWAEGGFDNAIDDQGRMEHKIDQAVTKILQRLPRL